jgi:hypothetical protein
MTTANQLHIDRFDTIWILEFEAPFGMIDLGRRSMLRPKVRNGTVGCRKTLRFEKQLEVNYQYHMRQVLIPVKDWYGLQIVRLQILQPAALEPIVQRRTLAESLKLIQLTDQHQRKKYVRSTFVDRHKARRFSH